MPSPLLANRHLPLTSSNRYRHELKFLLHPHQTLLVEQQIKNLMKLDDFVSPPQPGPLNFAPPDSSPTPNSYRVTSLYLDDYHLSAYFDKLNGEQHRVKYRLRIYNDTPQPIHLEIKMKTGDLSRKTVIPLTLAQYHQFLAGDERWATTQPAHSARLRHSPLAPSIPIYPAHPTSIFPQLLQKTKLLRPKIIVDYQRVPYCFTAGHVRLTLDKNLQYSTASADLLDHQHQVYQQVFDHSETIFEVKYDDFLPLFIQQLLDGLPLCRIAVSKYVLCQQKARSHFTQIRRSITH